MNIDYPHKRSSPESLFELLLATRQRDPLGVEKTIKNCSRPKSSAWIFYECIRTAAANNDSEIVKILVNNGVTVNKADEAAHNTPLHSAVTHQNFDLVNCLLTAGASAEFRNERGDTPLRLALSMNNAEIVDLILSKIFFAEQEGPLCIACVKSDIAGVERLIKSGADVNKPISNVQLFWASYTPLHFAVENNRRTEILRILLSQGADIGARNSKGETPLYLAVDMKNTYALKIMLSHLTRSDATINPVDVKSNVSLKYSPLHLAIENKSIEMIKLLVQNGADLLAKDSRGWTPLHLASLNYSLLGSEIIRLLLDNGADINVRSENGQTPLHVAVEYMNSKFDHYDPSSAAHYKGWTKILISLLTFNPDATAVDNKRRTALHLLAVKNVPQTSNTKNDIVSYYIEVIHLLTQAGCDINHRDHQGHTPLHLACKHQDIACAYALLRRGADIEVEDHHGKVPLYYSIHKLSVKGNRAFVCPVRYKMAIPQMWYIYALNVLNFPVSETNQNYYSLMRGSHEKQESQEEVALFESRFLKIAMQELTRMKQIVVMHDNLTLHDILHKDLNQMALYSTRDSLKRIMECHDFYEKFVLFGGVLKLQYSRGLIRHNLMNPAKEVLEILAGRGLPDPCSETILQYLSNQILEDLTRYFLK